MLQGISPPSPLPDILKGFVAGDDLQAALCPTLVSSCIPCRPVLLTRGRIVLDGAMMISITDEYMKEMIGTMREYCVVLLRAGPNLRVPGVEPIIWEHARRNFSLRAEGKLPIVCPVADGSEVCGVGIFMGGIETVRTIMDDDPAVMKGVFSYEIHPCRSFPGDCLPG